MGWRLACCAGMGLVFWLACGLSVADAEALPSERSEVLQTASRSLRLAIQDLAQSFPQEYTQAFTFLEELTQLENRFDSTSAERFERSLQQLNDLKRRALLANPLLDFDRLLVVKRSPNQMGLPANWDSNSSLPKNGYDNEIAILSPIAPDGELRTLYRPSQDGFVGDVDLDFDAGRLLFSESAPEGRWRIYELDANGTGLRELPLINEADVDNYDACYLPDGDLIFGSTAPFVGVPCVTGSSHVSNLYRWYRTTNTIRRLTFEQDHDWCPVIKEDGRVLYLRWEYSDLPHYVSRILFHMNPDGTGQMEYYGSNSYWPNSAFFARPIPNHPTQFVAVISGHHDVPRMGELVLFDVARGRREADGVVQRIPGYGKTVEPEIRDDLVQRSWPKFLHPWPLSDKYFIVSAQLTATSNWGIYLADVFDNMTLIKELDGYALLEPIPFQPRTRPPVVPDKVAPQRKDALVYLPDVYVGDGLKGVPRSAVKKLRLFTYQFAYHGMGGQINRVGLDGPWDIKRIIGTVPVEKDGSAYFQIPANTPISIQPLDADGKALQLMRSWMTAMPGETLTCVGCHEKQNSGPPLTKPMALSRAPSEIEPWYGPTRGFSFNREVQPVLDRYCISCHNGRERADLPQLPDFRALPPVHPQAAADAYNMGAQFPPSYLALRSFVRGHTIESDIHLLAPGEFHADTTQLVQLLARGHQGITLDPESWDRIITWIDLNTPAHGTWHEIVGDEKVTHQSERRSALMARYAGIDENPEAIIPTEYKPTLSDRSPDSAAMLSEVERTLHETIARVVPHDANEKRARRVDLGNGVQLDFVWIPGADITSDGSEIMHRSARASSRASSPVEVTSEGTDSHQTNRSLYDRELTRPFWMGAYEITNEQFHQFDPAHDSRLETGDFLQFSVQERGYPMNDLSQPVVRVSWEQAMAFCRWLSERTGETFTLPSELQWEYACRAGTETPLWCGDVESDFSAYANLADVSLRFVDTFGWGLPSGAIPPWRPAREDCNDGYRVTAPVGSYRPNPFGLYDMHGNIAEWTRSVYATGATLEPDTAGAGNDSERMVVRGGSWYDRPTRAQAAFRTGYRPYLPVFNVGFRVVCLPSEQNARTAMIR